VRARERIVGSFDRDVHSDEPDRPDRPDAPADRPGSPAETGSQLAERLGLPNLTRAAAYESLYAKAQVQDAPFRERLAREEREKSAESAESLTDSTGKPAPSIDNPDRAPEAPRTYWTEVPGFFATWQSHTDKWPRFASYGIGGQPERSDSRARSSGADARVDVSTAIDRIPRAEPRISEDFTRTVDHCSRNAWVAGFDFRLKGNDRMKQKVTEKLAAQPDRTSEEIVREIPDAIRYTCCLKANDYAHGVTEIKEGLERRGYEMYYSENYWSNAEYKGINSRWVSADGQRFEVQFHTAESFHAKHEVTHKAYERIRNPATSDRERLERKHSGLCT
jgi:hypothetical protein